MDKQLLSTEAIEALEYRIQQEEFSSRLYEDMKLWFEDKGYVNLAKIYKEYAEEEIEHAGWAKKFLLSYGLKPKLRALGSPESTYECCIDILEASLEHELTISEQCNAMTIAALKRSEMALYSLGMEYVKEQVDEVDKGIALLDIYKLTEDDLIFDEYVGKHYLD